MTKCAAIVLAGSRGGADALSKAAGVTHKALIRIGGQPMLERVLQTLLNCERIGDILVAGSGADLTPHLPGIAGEIASGRVRFMPASDTPGESVMSAIQSLQNVWPVLVTTADHPLLRAGMIAHLLDYAPAEMDAVAGIVERAVIQAAYPHTRRTYMRFRDIVFSGANLFLLRGPEALGVVGFWRHVEANRKRPWRLVAQLGFTSVMLFALGRLSLAQALDRLGKKCGASIGVVRLPFAEAAIDVDKPDDLAQVTLILA